MEQSRLLWELEWGVGGQERAADRGRPRMGKGTACSFLSPIGRPMTVTTCSTAPTTGDLADRLYGDQSEAVASWGGKSDTRRAGDQFALRVRMFQAKLFAYSA